MEKLIEQDCIADLIACRKHLKQLANTRQVELANELTDVLLSIVKDASNRTGEYHSIVKLSKYCSRYGSWRGGVMYAAAKKLTEAGVGVHGIVMNLHLKLVTIFTLSKRTETFL